jgi:NAD-dependent dihydropyrimidine dehydrogenase PreA subunit
VDCIHPRKDEPDFALEEMLYIDANVCIDCGLCVDECPVRAIYPEDDLPAAWRGYIEKNKAYYENKGG